MNKIETDSQIQKTDRWLPEGREAGRRGEKGEGIKNYERVDGKSQAVAAPSGALQISPRLWNQLFSGEPVVDSEAHHLVFVFPPSQLTFPFTLAPLTINQHINVNSTRKVLGLWISIRGKKEILAPTSYYKQQLIQDE